jgi:ectoine hydroxylase-related dioxygenase (phytanoyl-CoA dioxygenase family)
MMQQLTPEQEALLPTEADVAFYEEHGWYISPKVIPDRVIEEAIAGSEKLYRDERDSRLPVDSGYSDWKPGDSDTVRNNEFVSLQIKELRQLALQPIIGAIAARLARSKAIRLLDDQLVYKAPGDKNNDSIVGWHADAAYWSTCSSNKLLTAWIPFHDCDENRGPLVVIDGSHKWSGLQDARFFNYKNLDELQEKLRQQGKEVVTVPIAISQGQLSFHNCWTLHASYPNRSDLFRLAMAVHLQDEDNCYRAFTTPEGREIHIFDEVLARKLPNGDPDFSDPYVFPTIYSQAKSSYN